MIKKTIKYTTFDDEEVEDTLYFNLSMPELIDMEVRYSEGMGVMIQRIVKAENFSGIIEQFKRFILMAYGEKSEDGRYFLKSDEARARFAQSAAYEALYMELATDDKKAAEFLKGVMPKDVEKFIEEQEKSGGLGPPST